MHSDKVPWKRVGGAIAALLLLAGTIAGCASSALAPATPTTAGASNQAAPVATVSGASGAQPAAPAVSGAAPAGPAGVGQAAPAGRAAVAQAAPAVGAAPVSGIAQSSAQDLPPVATPNPAIVHGIVVSGNGQVKVKPDQATISAGVQTRATTAQEAQSQNNATMQKVVDAIKAQGIADTNIQTSGVSLYPNYSQGDVVTGYTASNNVTVVVDKLDQVGAVLDAATKAGANVEGNVNFSLKNDAEARNQALQAAAADAKSKATALASALGLQITSVQSVSEGITSTPIYVPQRVAVASAAAAPSVPVEPGQMTVSAQVTIVFGY